MTDTIYPSYYDKPGAINLTDCQDTFTRDMQPMEAYYIATCLKYLYRYNQKNGVEDLKKAMTFIEMTIKLISDDPNIIPRDKVGKSVEYEESIKKARDRIAKDLEENPFHIRLLTDDYPTPQEVGAEIRQDALERAEREDTQKKFEEFAKRFASKLGKDTKAWQNIEKQVEKQMNDRIEKERTGEINFPTTRDGDTLHHSGDILIGTDFPTPTDLPHPPASYVDLASEQARFNYLERFNDQ